MEQCDNDHYRCDRSQLDCVWSGRKLHYHMRIIYFGWREWIFWDRCNYVQKLFFIEPSFICENYALRDERGKLE